jgi:hypothetical protein
VNRIDILFKTARFNLSEVKPHFINPCCFGEDLATWLGKRLSEDGVSVALPAGQEDWGWYVYVSIQDGKYFLGIGGNAEDGDSRDYGEWRIMVEKRRSILDRLSGKNVLSGEDAIVRLIENILRGESDFRELRRE